MVLVGSRSCWVWCVFQRRKGQAVSAEEVRAAARRIWPSANDHHYAPDANFLRHYGEESCGICGGYEQVSDYGWMDEGDPMLTCGPCGPFLSEQNR